MNVKAQIVLVIVVVVIVTTGCNSTSQDDTPMVEVPVVKITDVTVKALDSDGNHSFYTDTLRQQVRFSVYTEYEITGYEMVPDVQPLHSGDMIPGIVSNPTKPAFASLSFPVSINYKGSTIEAGLNLLDDTEIQESFDGSQSDLFFNRKLWPFAVGQVTFRQGAFQFETGPHEIIFTWGNSEEMFSDTVQVHIHLQEH